ncbi:MAG TPA: hypothetical protein VGI39_42385 [Polyangiaceae bacterium]|jgi:hypothetical protein
MVRDGIAAAFVVIVLSVVPLLPIAVFVAAVRRGEGARTAGWKSVFTALALVAWMALSSRLALSGFLLDFGGKPPRFSRLVGGILLGTVLLGSSPFARRLARALPMAALVGFQLFRLPVELVLNALHHQGRVPIQMTFEGWNFDILTGLSAPLVAALAHQRRLPRAVLALWNFGAFLLLATIVTLANLSSPALNLFPEPPTATLATAPFIWLPVVLVPAALLGHLLVLRKLLQR